MGTSKFITGSGDIQLNQDLWKKCPYKVIYKVTTCKVVSQQIYIVFRKKKNNKPKFNGIYLTWLGCKECCRQVQSSSP